MIRPLVCSFLSCLLLTTGSSRVSADTLSTVAVADSEVDALQPTLTFPTGDLAAAKEGASGSPAIQLTFFYAQFDLPGGLTGDGIQTVNSADLTIFQNGPDFSLTYYVYGVLDGLDTASANTYTWNQGIGHDPTHNEVRFLTGDEISYYSDPAKSVFVGTLDTGTAGPGPINFAGTPQSPTAAAALKNLVLNDTDGRLTFYVGSRANFGVTAANTFASLETGTPNLAAPTLTLNFVPVPEPSAMLLAACSAVMFGLSRKQRG